jgi:16S rRNA processing protein RimM
VQLVVGRIGRAHGIHGELSVDVRTDDPERRFATGMSVHTDPPEAGPLTVLRARPHSGRLLVTFDGVNDRSAAEALRGTLLVVDSSTSPPTEDPDEFWDHELVGLRVETVSGEHIGEISEVLHLPVQDLLVVTQASGAELLVPFVASIVPGVDIASGKVVIDPPSGLLVDDEDAEA